MGKWDSWFETKGLFEFDMGFGGYGRSLIFVTMYILYNKPNLTILIFFAFTYWLCWNWYSKNQVKVTLLIWNWYTINLLFILVNMLWLLNVCPAILKGLHLVIFFQFQRRTNTIDLVGVHGVFLKMRLDFTL